MEPDLELLFEEPEGGDTSSWVMFSIILHGVLVIWLLTHHSAPAKAQPDAPMTRYVELMRQTPFTEAPGKKSDTAPLTAPFSNANRKASMPAPTGEKPTLRPGEGDIFSPSSSATPRSAAPQKLAASSLAQPPAATAPASSPTSIETPDNQTKVSHADALAASKPVDWRSAIKEVGKVASLGGASDGGQNLGSDGGEKGFAESGPVSFETQWYDWGDYAEGMVRKIRQNWYDNMPSVIRMGLKGVVTIRFTIERNGTIDEITTLESSGVPPFDFAARKALELSSKLAPLPADFIKHSEHVTVQFYYNMNVPGRK